MQAVLVVTVVWLIGMENGRPALAFIAAQAFNVLWTLLLAYLLFGGILCAPPPIH